MTREAVAPAVLLVVDNPNSEEKIFVKEFSSKFGVVITYSPSEAANVLKNNPRKPFKVILLDGLSLRGISFLFAYLENKNDSVPLETIISPVCRESLFREDSLSTTGPGVYTKSPCAMKRYDKYLSSLEDKVQDFSSDSFYGVFEYTEHSLHAVLANRGFLSCFKVASLKELKDQLPNFLSILEKQFRIFFEAILEENIDVYSKVSFHLLQIEPTKNMMLQLKVSLAPISYQTEIKKAFCVEIGHLYTVLELEYPVLATDSLPQNEVDSQERTLFEQIPHAMETHQIVFFLQPVFDSNKQAFVSAEALARWNHPDKGMVFPDSFIPLLEKSNRILELDLYILDAVCIFQRSLIDEGITPLPISVNLSQLDFYDSNLTAKILSIVEQSRIPHSLIGFEITETAYMDNHGQLTATLELLNQNGFSLLLDDYGSGYSSLEILTNAPIDILKIDKNFSQQVGDSRKMETTLQNLVVLAHSIDVEVIVEGVENELQAEFFKSISCNQIQGYFYAKPMSLSSFKKLLEVPKKEILPCPVSSNSFYSGQFFAQYQVFLKAIATTIFFFDLENDSFRIISGNSFNTSFSFESAGSVTRLIEKLKKEYVHPDDLFLMDNCSNRSYFRKLSQPGDFDIITFRLLDNLGIYRNITRTMIRESMEIGKDMFICCISMDANPSFIKTYLLAILELEKKHREEARYWKIVEHQDLFVFEWDGLTAKEFKSPGTNFFAISNRSFFAAFREGRYEKGWVSSPDDKKMQDFFKEFQPHQNKSENIVVRLVYKQSLSVLSKLSLISEIDDKGNLERVICTIAPVDAIESST
ncbi:EAL domain-containing protein [uncultured Sphaerochaeta sp.]|uniref:EAL domain-containing protein n=1 Tax=uncultured Sphaerochaeta sp. TaxID=886478 RepID=UPI002A0A2192|nr:EAL domain-containing protein [uncultured Sphaerochaeta sp.]